MYQSKPFYCLSCFNFTDQKQTCICKNEFCSNCVKVCKICQVRNIKRRKECPECGVDLPDGNYTKHYDFCINRPTKCKVCGYISKKNEFLPHLANNHSINVFQDFDEKNNYIIPSAIIRTNLRIPSSNVMTTYHSHPLQYVHSNNKGNVQYNVSGFKCDVCGISFVSGLENLYCRTCGFDLCDFCFVKTLRY